MAVDVTRYLQRIGITRSVQPDLASLRAIHWAHLQHVPFENLDIRPLGLPISLDLDVIERKIVGRRRGGFCYELNGLLAEVLITIGFEVTRVSVLFVLEDGSISPPFDHMALLVRPEGSPDQFFADVGCGRSSPAYPLPLVADREEHQPETGYSYRLNRDGERWRFDTLEPGSDWKPNHFFSEEPRQLTDFADRCHFQWSDPNSHFTQRPLCSMNLPGGRVTLSGTSLIVTQGETRTESILPDEASFHRALREHFGMSLQKT